MNLSLFAQNLRGPWMIHPDQAAAMMPIVKGIISGYEMDLDKIERKESMRVKCSDYLAGVVLDASPYSEKSVFITYLTGTMTKYGTCIDYGTRDIANGLLDADADPEIIGHIIVADSGGGASDSVPELADAIRQLTKPIIGFVDGMAASACIYALSYTQKIIAHQPTDQIGCVGTMMTISGWPQFRKDKDGYVEARIYADQSSEKNADYEAALQGDVKLIKEDILNPLCERFISDMKANRPSATDDQLHGKTYFAENVIGTLIDSIGTFDDAIREVISLAESAESKNEKNINQMKYTQLSSIPELQEQQYAEDGSTVLQECQLVAIEAALAAHHSEADLQAQMESLTESHLAEVTALQQTITSRDETISSQAARIAELESALNAAIARNEGAAPAAVSLDADPASGSPDGAAPAKNWAEAQEACKQFLNR